MRNEHKEDTEDVPSIHRLMIQCAMGTLILCGIGYFFAPEAKQGFFEQVGILSFGLLAGKFTNGFGRRSLK